MTLSGATGAQLAGRGLTLTGDVQINDDDFVPPLIAANVKGAELELIYQAQMDKNSVPAVSDFVVNVSGSPRAVQSVSIGDPVGAFFLFFTYVTLTLDSEVNASEPVTLSYTPGANPLLSGGGPLQKSWWIRS